MPKEITFDEYIKSSGRAIWYRITETTKSLYTVDENGTGIVEERVYGKTKKYLRYSQFEKVACLNSDDMIKLSR